MKVTIIARKSALSQIQAQEVLQRILAQHPSLEVEVIKREVEGDLDLRTPLAHFDQRGVFTREFSEILTTGEADIAVHSWKDLPTENVFKTEIAATLPRADQRDTLLIKSSSLKLKPANLRILTSSPRRAWALEQHIGKLLPWSVDSVQCEPVRGAIPTRFKKLLESECDGLVVAKAALDRILSSSLNEIADSREYIKEVLKELKWMVLPLKLFPNAPAQGALALEISSQRSDLKKLLESVNCEKTFSAVAQERKILAGYGGGCHQKIGAAIIDRPYGRISCITGVTSSGTVLDNYSLERSPSETDRLKTTKAQHKLWSSSGISKTHFERISVHVDPPKASSLLYVTKEHALPDEWDISHHIVWSAGLTTWEKLAARGIWVNGSNEGLGDVEIPDLSMYMAHPGRTVRLTHLTGDGVNVIQTYKLELIAPVKIPEDVTHCFWTSGAIFEQVLKLNPHLLKVEHASGPGSTFEHLSSNKELKRAPVVYLSEVDWRKELQE